VGARTARARWRRSVRPARPVRPKRGDRRGGMPARQEVARCGRPAAGGGGYADPGRLTPGAYLHPWLGCGARGRQAGYARTRRRRERAGGQVLGPVRPRSLTPRRIQRRVNDMATRLAPLSTRTRYTGLRTAPRSGVARTRPAAGVKGSGGEGEMSCRRAVQAAACLRAVEAARDHAPLGPSAPAFAVRAGTQLGLGREDVDPEQGVVRVTQRLAWPMGGGPERILPRMARSRRRLGGEPGAVAAPRHHRAQRSASRRQRGSASRDLNLAFHPRRADCLRQEAGERALHVPGTACDRPRRRLQGPRQAHAPALLRQGRIVREASHRLGPEASGRRSRQAAVMRV
jgi:hypothetical protein